MKEQNNITYQLIKGVIQKMIRIEAEDWPPITFCGMYQPRRPKTQEKETGSQIKK